MSQTKRTRTILRAAWRHAVAAYVLFHIASIVIGSIPAPVDALNRRAWADPTVQEEFTAWAQRLNRLGWRVDSAKLQDVAWNLFKSWMRWTETATLPFQRYQRLTGTVQSWSMFVAPNTHPSILHMEVCDRDGDWRPIYVARSREFTWRRAQLDHIRLRSAIFRYAWPQFGRDYRQFAAWLAVQAARDFPHASDLRLRMFKYRTPSPDELRAGRNPGGRFTSEVILPLSEHR